MKKKKSWMSALVMLALFHPLVQAQDQGVGDMMFSAGTVMTDGSGQEWAWLQWMATDSALMKDREMDIYLKAGDADSVNAFSIQGRVQQITDPRSIELLLTRGEMLGENLINLEVAVDSLYAGAEPIGSLTLAEKLSALVSGSQDDMELYQNLVFMGRAHPAVSMVIGQGFAGKIPSADFSTFEVRDHSTAEVIGRITLQAGAPEVLPAPGPIVRVPETSPMGNLNIRLRWDIPDDLKRVSLLQFGYNLYRVTKYSAEKWWESGGVPSSTTELLEFVNNESYSSAKKVNRMPILVDAATVTPETWFAVDDNEGQSDGGTPFVDGVEYYYYVTALDLLGRDGEVSAPFLTFPCDRMAPSVPHGVTTRTISEYNTNTQERIQFVEVSWDHRPDDVDTARYYVYRHSGLSNMQSNAAFAVSNRISGAIVPSPEDNRMVYEDRSLGTNEFGFTYWYTVRAEDDARCAKNLSGNSAPAHGLLRDWEGPLPVLGVVMTIQVERLEISFLEETSPVLVEPLNVEISCTRDDASGPIEWVEFAWYSGEYTGIESEMNLISLGRFYYPNGEVLLARAFFFDPYAETVTLFSRVGSASGKKSPWAHHSVNPPSSKFPPIGVRFKGEYSLVHVPHDEDPGPHHWGVFPIVFPVITIPATPGAETVRVYRRVDGGRRALIHQGVMSDIFGAVITDYSGGAVNGAVICYYYQVYDEHGNAGAMIKLGCFMTEPRADLPTPLLAPIDSTGTVDLNPGLSLNWFCTPPGVERFELAIGVSDGDFPATFGTSSYTLTGFVPEMEMVVQGVTNTMRVGLYRTGRVGTTFGVAGSPQFLLNSPVDLDRKFSVMVRAIGTVGTEGAWSNAEEFRWNTVPVDGPEVPWPTRPRPDVQSDPFHNELEAHYLIGSDLVYQSFYGPVGIRIGEIPANISFEWMIDTSGGGDAKDKKSVYRFTDKYKLEDFLYDNADVPGESAFPCVLYRYQLTNDLYRTVSGDVAQVSPLMEEMAVGANGGVTTLYDPFIFITRKTLSGDPWGIYLLDTQPVIRGASYQYLLMRFDEETHELDRTIPAGTVTIP